MSSTAIEIYRYNPNIPGRRYYRNTRRIINTRTTTRIPRAASGTYKYYQQAQRINMAHRMSSPWVRGMRGVKGAGAKVGRGASMFGRATKISAGYQIRKGAFHGNRKMLQGVNWLYAHPVAGKAIASGIVYGGTALGVYGVYKGSEKIAGAVIKRSIKRRNKRARKARQVAHGYKNTPPKLTTQQRQQMARRRRRVKGRFA